ncbi:MAG TPA: Fe-Mn family superoxide dismutase [Phycisphaerae bacterium]|nr:Fe-Mn family superoxide dismutase [Phycisphaerae bacterium]
MPNLTPRSFPRLAQCDALSKTCVESHLRLYDGYVHKYNELMAKRDSHLGRGPSALAGDLEGLKADITFALGAVKNHELYFDILGPECGEPGAELMDAIARSFHSLPQFLIDLRQTAMQTRGWAFTAYDLDHDTLFNYESGHNGLPVWNAVPILAIDLYGHAYFYDFGNNRGAYIEAIMKCLDWSRIRERFLTAKAFHRR